MSSYRHLIVAMIVLALLGSVSAQQRRDRREPDRRNDRGGQRDARQQGQREIGQSIERQIGLITNTPQA